MAIVRISFSSTPQTEPSPQSILSPIQDTVQASCPTSWPIMEHRSSFPAAWAAALWISSTRGVEVIVGVQGDATAAVESYLKGELVSTGSICHEHEHADECGEHH